MICFHYHVARFDVPRLGIRRFDTLCHVFSDLADVSASLDELQDWARNFLPPRVRVQQRGYRRQHIDLWGEALAICGASASRSELRRWLKPTDHTQTDDSTAERWHSAETAVFVRQLVTEIVESAG